MLGGRSAGASSPPGRDQHDEQHDGHGESQLVAGGLADRQLDAVVAQPVLPEAQNAIATPPNAPSRSTATPRRRSGTTANQTATPIAAASTAPRE